MAHHSDPLNQYCEAHTPPESDLARALFAETKETMIGAEMLSGHLSSAFLQFLIRLIDAKKILEIGTFTGHGALSMAEALPDDGQIITLEKSTPGHEFAKRYFAQSPHGHKIDARLGLALELLPELINTVAGTFDLIFIDADKPNYPNYVDASIKLLRIGGLMIVDNALWGGRVLNPETKQDIGIDTTNKRILQDPRLENILLPIADGMHLARKTKN